MDSPKKNKTIVFDLDGCLCTQVDGDYKNAKPNPEAIRVVNALYNDGHHIVIHTSRFMNRARGNVKKAHEIGYEFTKKQLASWGALYHELVLGKPYADVVVDDRSPFFNANWQAIDKEIRKKIGKSEAATELETLKKIVYEQNRRLPQSHLVILTEGNVSQISSDRSYVVIKPSGVEYDDLTPDKMVTVDMKRKIIEGALRPSSDTPTHLEIYGRFSDVGGIVHTHSPYATAFAQMKKPIPCFGTTHADTFFGDIPVTRELTEEEIVVDYELNTGKIIAEVLNPKKSPAVLVASHGVFVVGRTAKEAVDHACVAEKVAMAAILSGYGSPIINDVLLKKHFFRKHGKGKYYGQIHED